jgi:hypothetical protein
MVEDSLSMYSEVFPDRENCERSERVEACMELLCRFDGWLANLTNLSKLGTWYNSRENSQRSSPCLEGAETKFFKWKTSRCNAGGVSPVNRYGPGLPDSMAAVLRLTVHLGVEVHVMEDDSVGARQI